MHSAYATHRELNPQHRAVQRAPALARNRQRSAHGPESQFQVRAGVSAGQSKYTVTPPRAAIQHRYQCHRCRLVETEMKKPAAFGLTLCPLAQESTLEHLAARRQAPCSNLRLRRRRGVPRLLCLWRQAGGQAPRVQGHATRFSPRVPPNPSFKPSPNGMPPGPGHRYGVHFLWPGPGVMPLVPA